MWSNYVREHVKEYCTLWEKNELGLTIYDGHLLFYLKWHFSLENYKR